MQNILQSYQFQFNFFWKYFYIWASHLSMEEEETEMNSSELKSKINSSKTTLFSECIPEPSFHPNQQHLSPRAAPPGSRENPRGSARLAFGLKWLGSPYTRCWARVSLEELTSSCEQCQSWPWRLPLLLLGKPHWNKPGISQLWLTLPSPFWLASSSSLKTVSSPLCSRHLWHLRHRYPCPPLSSCPTAPDEKDRWLLVVLYWQPCLSGLQPVVLPCFYFLPLEGTEDPSAIPVCGIISS